VSPILYRFSSKKTLDSEPLKLYDSAVPHKTSVNKIADRTRGVNRRRSAAPRTAATVAIRKRLIDLGWTVTELARRVGLARQYVSQVVHGKPRAGKPAQERIAAALGMATGEAFPESTRRGMRGVREEGSKGVREEGSRGTRTAKGKARRVRA
jgi:lambda repressor-like predicted transcriptional regulator